MKTNLSIYRYKFLSLIFGTCLAGLISLYIFSDQFLVMKSYLLKIVLNIIHNESVSADYELLMDLLSSEVPKTYCVILAIIEFVSCVAVFWMFDHLSDQPTTRSKNEK